MAVGVSEIDLQHQEIFGILSSLQELQDRDPSTRAVQKVIDELRYYVHKHVVTEEDYIQYAGCGHGDEQKHDHEAFLDSICTYQRNFLSRRGVTVADLLDDFGRTFADHVRELDVPCLTAPATPR